MKWNRWEGKKCESTNEPHIDLCKTRKSFKCLKYQSKLLLTQQRKPKLQNNDCTESLDNR